LVVSIILLTFVPSKLNDMPTIKKPSKAQVKQTSIKNIDKVLIAIENGAKVVKREHWNKIEYGVEYPTGGYFKITKTIYDKVIIK
jgi:hypothetical protein